MEAACPCQRLLDSLSKVEKLEKEIVRMHSVINQVMAEYNRLHIEEDALGNIMQVFQSQHTSIEKFYEVQDICKKAMKIVNEIKEQKIIQAREG